MIDVVNISGTTPIQKVQNSTRHADVSGHLVPIKQQEPSFISSRIRVDNLLNLAILEVRSHDTGDIIRQYPTEGQIKSFQHAAELTENASEIVETTTETASAPINTAEQQSTNIDSGQTTTTTASLSTSQTVNTNTEQTNAPTPPTTSNGTGGNSTQSIVV